MGRKWDRFNELFCLPPYTAGPAGSGLSCATPRNPRFLLKNPTANVPAFDSYTGTTRNPTPPYSWIECTDPADIARTCQQVFLDAGIQLNGGDGYGAAAGAFVRLELLMHAATFEAIGNRLEVLLSGGPYRPVLPGYWQPPAVVTTMPPLPVRQTDRPTDRHCYLSTVNSTPILHLLNVIISSPLPSPPLPSPPVPLRPLLFVWSFILRQNACLPACLPAFLPACLPACLPAVPA
eukprot:SAG22_NODE_2513_length_2489_cov_3.750628_1_plen_234_part_10